MDCTLNESLHFTIENTNAKLLGRVPCVVQLPFQDYLDTKFDSRGIYNVALAEFGADWIGDLLRQQDPDVIMGVGIEGFVNEPLMDERGYTNFNSELLSNSDFKDFVDPKGRYCFFSAIPLVAVVDKSQANGRKIPKTFADLFGPEYENSMVYPDDGHMLDSIMLTYIYKEAGEEGLKAFKRNCFAGVHPSQMIKPGGLEKKPFIMLMPWVFARLKALQPNMELVWFEDGAPILPLVVTAKNNETAKEITEVLFDEKAGIIFRKNGFFPSGSTNVNNDLPGKLKFIGWDFIYRPDLLDIISFCRKVVE